MFDQLCGFLVYPDQRLIHVVDCDTVGLLEVLSVGLLNPWGSFSWFLAFFLMGEEERCRGSSLLDAVYLVRLVVTVSGDHYCAFESIFGLFTHSLYDL